MKPSEQLEREAERRRSNVAANLTELRERLRPGQLTDDALSFAGGQTGALLNTFGKQVASNPVPALLIGAGIAWLCFGGSQRKPGAYRADGYDSEGVPHRDRDNQDASDLYDKGASTVSSVAGKAASAATAIRDKAASAASAVGDTAASAFGAASDTVAGAARATAQKASDIRATVAGTTRRAIHDAGDSASATAKAAMRGANQAADATALAAEDAWLYLKDQPLLLMGIGLAVGSIIGTALPRTKFEDRLVGDTSDDIKERAEAALAEGLSGARDIGEKVLDTAADETKAHLSSAAQAQRASGSGSEREQGQSRAGDGSMPQSAYGTQD